MLLLQTSSMILMTAYFDTIKMSYMLLGNISVQVEIILTY